MLLQEILFYLMQIRFLNDKNSQNNASQVLERSIYAIFNTSKNLNFFHSTSFNNPKIEKVNFTDDLGQ